MAKVSYSYIDAILRPMVPKIYTALRIPGRFPPEGIVLTGHIVAFGTGIAVAYSSSVWWCGIFISIGVCLNQILDMLDGAHARATNQCRNSGELLDHFLDPLGYAYWIIGLSIAAKSIPLAIPCLLLLYCTATISYLTQRFTDELRLTRFGPTEFRVIIALYGVIMTTLHLMFPSEKILIVFPFYFIVCAIPIYSLNVIIMLWQSMQRVNKEAPANDTSEWLLVQQRRGR